MMLSPVRYYVYGKNYSIQRTSTVHRTMYSTVCFPELRNVVRISHVRNALPNTPPLFSFYSRYRYFDTTRASIVTNDGE